VGTTPAAFVAHGIDTTIVEIDPVVHEFASKYFRLPENHTPVIDDAIMYTWKLSQDPDGQRFDYIVHDVFTGGAEPIPLFTLEFLQGLNTLLKPDGVIAIVGIHGFSWTPPRLTFLAELCWRLPSTSPQGCRSNYPGGLSLVSNIPGIRKAK